MRHRVSAGLALGLVTLALALPTVSGAQDAGAKPVPVMLDLYSGDKNSQGFSEALAAAVSGDARFEVVKALPPEGLKIIMTDALVPQHNDDQAIAGYDVVLKLGNGKYIDEKQGFCDLAKLAMCGRVVAQDSFDAYQAYMVRRKAG